MRELRNYNRQLVWFLTTYNFYDRSVQTIRPVVTLSERILPPAPFKRIKGVYDFHRWRIVRLSSQMPGSRLHPWITQSMLRGAFGAEIAANYSPWSFRTFENPGYNEFTSRSFFIIFFIILARIFRRLAVIEFTKYGIHKTCLQWWCQYANHCFAVGTGPALLPIKVILNAHKIFKVSPVTFTG